MKNKPLVSVVVPCYNHEEYVEETIESVLNQTYKNIELIVIDDGSKDNSVQVIQQLADKYGFTFIYRSNKGLSTTLNEAIGLSKGKYISLCASDDVYMFDKIETQVEFMEEQPEYGMCYGKVVYFEDSIENTSEYQNSNKQGWVFEDLLHDCFIPAPSTFIRKDVLEELSGFDDKLWIEDWDMWLRIAQKYQIGFIDEFFTYYRMHDTNISKETFKMYEAEKKILEKYINNKHYKKVIDKHKVMWFSLLSRSHKKESLKYLSHSIKYIFTDLTVLKSLVKLVFMKK